MTCNRCKRARHSVKYCEDFELTWSGDLRPRAWNTNPHSYPPSEPAFHRARTEWKEPAPGEISLPSKPVEVIGPSKDRSERSQAARSVFDPTSSSQASHLHKSAHIEEDMSENSSDQYLQRLRDRPMPGSSPKEDTSITSTSEQLKNLTQEPGKASTPPATRSNISPRDPRQRRSPAYTPLVSPLQSLQMSREPGVEPDEDVSGRPQMLGEPPSNSYQNRRLGVGATPPSQTPFRQEEYQSHPPSQREAYGAPASIVKKEYSGRKDGHHSSALTTQNEGRSSRAPSQADPQSAQAHTRTKDGLVPASAPNERSAADDDSLDAIEAHMRAFEDEERVKQAQHEAELAQRRLRQRIEFEHELAEKMAQKKHDADMARRAAVQRQEEEHERRLAELRRR